MYWQHSGEGVSSRRAEYCHKAFENGTLVAREFVHATSQDSTVCKGPRRYQKNGSVDLKTSSQTDRPMTDKQDFVQFVEERFGRNLDISLAYKAKKAIRKRIAGALCVNVELTEALDINGGTDEACPGRSLSEDDVYLYPCGMSSIFNAHRILMSCRGSIKSISFGFPYIDTLKILEKWGPGCVFYGHGESDDLDDLEELCKRGHRFLALFCEFPGNPLLKTPDLKRIKHLADLYDFAVVVDETIGNFINVDVLPFADIVVSSLTKVFTGEANVMGGSLVINPDSKYYRLIKKAMTSEYEDNYWPEDAIFMERNSRDFISRIHRINSNAEMVCEILKGSPIVREVFYPKCNSTRPLYEQCRNPDGGYGGLLSVTFQNPNLAVRFFDELDTAKGPSLGTNFTLSSPYVILAHYGELEWAEQYGVDASLIRISVGLEDATSMRSKFEQALDIVQNANIS